MSVIISQIRGELGEPEDIIIERALKNSCIPRSCVRDCGIHKTSLDSRRQNDIHFVHSVFVRLADPEDEKRYAQKKNCRFIGQTSPMPEISGEKTDGRVVIAGFGPAGMFCGLVLAEYGYKPIIAERGEPVEKRIESVKKYWNGGVLDTESNVQFGEGGAGTFSDGKLTTRINDPLCGYVLERLVQAGAPREILTKAKPHIGTDKLTGIVRNIRNRITELGGEVRFGTKLENINIKNSRVTSALLGNNTENVSALVLAIGHSARDTFEMLLDNGVFAEPKPFSVGVRIEHRQSEVDESLYGKRAGDPLLPKGEYQLSHRKPDGRCVYTFCMCPGGFVVPSASESKTIVTNGMSEYARNGENANAALVVSVSKNDFGSGVLDGVNFARKIEQAAYKTGGGKAPAVTVGGFSDGRPSLKTSIIPSYAAGVAEAELRDLLPDFVTGMLEEGLAVFSKKMSCFGNKNAVMTAPETRTSSPIRITRTEDMRSVSFENLYPCGEGAGYAGGIMSAAVDGVKTAFEIMKRIAPQ